MMHMKNLHGTDQRTMAFINLYGVLGTLEELCALDSHAKDILGEKRIAVGFQVSGGPSATLTFDHGACTFSEGVERCDIKLPFSTPEKFNGMIDCTVTPFPSKGLTKVRFLTKEFIALTDQLTKYLRASEEELKDPAFFQTSTTLMFYTIASAISQIGNEDRIGQASASYIPDGVIQLSIKGGPTAMIEAKNHRLKTIKQPGTQAVSARMEFGSMEIARDLFEGRRNSLACIGTGEICLGGRVPMLDNMNRILDRVALYLA